MPTAQASKFCRDCRYLEGESQSVCARCANPVALAWLEAEAEPDMVTGELIIAPPHCKFLRILPESPCGPKGKLFEQDEEASA